MKEEVCPHSVSQNWNGDASCNKKRDAALRRLYNYLGWIG